MSKISNTIDEIVIKDSAFHGVTHVMKVGEKCGEGIIKKLWLEEMGNTICITAFYDNIAARFYYKKEELLQVNYLLEAEE